jgi:hypothetical protein
MRRFFIIAGVLVGLVVAGGGALLMFPQVTETVIKLTCSMTDPSENCQQRMLAMGHVWSRKGRLDRATIWYARAAQKHYPPALFHLAWVIEEGGYGDVKDAVVKLAADNNGFGGAADFDNGRAGHDKFEAAAKLYRMAADDGFAPAANNLGDMYLSGAFGQGHEDDAFKWHLAAAKAGNPVASLNVSLDYQIGRGTAADRAAAETYATIRPQSGSPDVGSLTLARTRLAGTAVDPHMVATIRDAANRHEPLTINFRPMQPDARLPTFHQIRTGLE